MCQEHKFKQNVCNRRIEIHGEHMAKHFIQLCIYIWNDTKQNNLWNSAVCARQKLQGSSLAHYVFITWPTISATIAAGVHERYKNRVENITDQKKGGGERKKWTEFRITIP